MPPAVSDATTTNTNPPTVGSSVKTAISAMTFSSLVWIWALLAAWTAPAATAQTAASVQTPARTYVGQDTCVGCHDTEGTTIQRTLHGKAQNPKTPAAAHGCESCHGPG